MSVRERSPDASASLLSLMYAPCFTVTLCSNSSVIWLPRASGADVSAVNVYGTGSNLNVAKLTGIFGSQYEIAQAAGTIVAHNLQAEQLAQALVLPTVVAAAVVIFSNADRVSS